MIVDIPNRERLVQLNKGDFEGTIWSTRNIDLKTKRVSIKPSQKLIVTTLSGDTDNPTDLAVGFCRATGTIGGISSTRWWAVAGTSVYETSSENGDFDEDDSGTLPTTDGKDETDIKSFNGRVYVASDVNLYRRTSSTYTTVSTGLTNGYKILEVYNNTLYIMSDTVIESMNTAETVATSGASTLDISTASNDNISMSCMRRVSNGIWIGTYNNAGGRARVMFWDGVTANTVEINKEIESGMVMGMTIKDDLPYILDNRGVLSYFNGSYFEEVARFDFNQKLLYRFDIHSSSDRWLHPNGMQTIDDEILMAVNTRMSDTNDSQVVRTPSGVYAFNSEFGIYHKYAFTAQRDSATVVDQAQLEAVEVGAIYSMVDDERNTDQGDMSDFFVAFAYKSDNSTTKYAIAKNDKRGLDINASSTAEAGVIIYSKFPSEQVQEQWEKLYLFFKPLANSSDKIVVKYRIQDHDPVESSITWVNTTSFTSTDSDWATIKTNFEAGVDYEVEGLQGDGAGFCSHISNIAEAGGTYTVTVDETITGATTNTAKVRVDRWTKIGEFTDDSEVESFKEFNPEVTSSWIQFKVYMLGDGIELQRTLSKSSVNQEI